MTLAIGFCLEARKQALGGARPAIFHRAQGAPCTSLDFTGRLAAAGSQISMDGRGRVLDNVFVAGLWRTVTYEAVYVRDDATPRGRGRG